MAEGEMTCQELVELVTEYLEGTLPEADVVRFEAHLAGCTGCRRYLNQARQTISQVNRLTEESLAPAMRNELLMLFRDWKENP